MEDSHTPLLAIRMKSPYGNPSAQNGVALFVGLIMLLLLTIIGTVGMQTTSLEEKMAGNMRDRNLAFQAAESALVAGETYLTTAALPIGCNKSNGLYDNTGACAAVDVPVWENIGWDNNDSAAYTGVLSNISANPRYIIEDLGCLPAPAVCPGVHNYRITARAQGGTTDAIVILQSIYQI